MSAPLSGWQPGTDFAGDPLSTAAQDIPSPVDTALNVAVPAGTSYSKLTAPATYDMSSFLSWKLSITNWDPAEPNYLRVTAVWYDLDAFGNPQPSDSDGCVFNPGGANSPLTAFGDARWCKGPVKGQKLGLVFTNIGAASGNLSWSLTGSHLPLTKFVAREGSAATATSPLGHLTDGVLIETSTPVAVPGTAYLLLSRGTLTWTLGCASLVTGTAVNGLLRYNDDAGNAVQIDAATATGVGTTVTHSGILLPNRPCYVGLTMTGGGSGTATLLGISLGDG